MTQDERLLILQMVADGKVSVNEAAELLRAVETTDQAAGKEKSGRSTMEPGSTGTNTTDFGARAADFGSGLSAFIDNVLDQVSGAFHETVGPRYEFPSEQTGEFTGDEVPLRILTHNGKVQVYAWDQPGYRANILVKVRAATEEEARRRAATAYILNTENGFDLESRRHDLTGDVAVHVTLMVPRSKRYRLESRTSNGPVELAELTSPNASVTTANGRVTLRGGRYDQLELRSGNGSVEVESAVTDLDATTGNGSITVRPTGSGHQSMRIATGNGSARVDCSRLSSDTGYRIEAHTGMGSISVSLPDLVYDREVRSMGHKQVVARSSHFEQAGTTVTVRAATGLGSVKVD